MVSANAPPGDDSPFLEGSFLLHDVGLDEPGGGEATSRSPHSPLTPQTPQPATGTPTKGSEPMLIEERTLATSRDGQSSFDPMEYDFINESDFSSLRSSAPNQSSVDEYCVLEGFLEKPADNKLYRFARSESGLFVSNSLSKMRLGLLKLLENVLFSLPADHVPAVIGEVLKAEYLLVWAFHDSVTVRELAVKVRPSDDTEWVMLARWPLTDCLSYEILKSRLIQLDDHKALFNLEALKLWKRSFKHQFEFVVSRNFITEHYLDCDGLLCFATV